MCRGLRTEDVANGVERGDYGTFGISGGPNCGFVVITTPESVAWDKKSEFFEKKLKKI